ncbi:Adhesion defective protein 1 [Leucoagaricus sp. SymC.cos]|nr:Adhesion defective protein 1 [Leucoagaricus sp. SymC.cos]
MKLTLWKDNQRKEAKPFEIGVPILPRFFLVTTQSGVKSMSLSLDGARERQIATGHCIVECVAAVWTYRYTNGYTVTLRGALSAHVVITSTSAPGTNPNPAQPSTYAYKFDEFTFDANYHDKYIALDAIVGQRVPEPTKSPWIRSAPDPTENGTPESEDDKKWEEPRVNIERCSIPGEPVNAFGIPQATMRCLELAESVGSMADLIVYSNETQLGPLEALRSIAGKIRDGTHVPSDAQSAPGTSSTSTQLTPTTATGIAAATGAAGVNGYPPPPLHPSHPPGPPGALHHPGGAPFNPSTLYGAQNPPPSSASSAPPSSQPPPPPGSTQPQQQRTTPGPPHPPGSNPASHSSPATAVNSPQTHPNPNSAMNSPQKVHKPIPQPLPGGSGPGPAQGISGMLGGGGGGPPGTPAMAGLGPPGPGQQQHPGAPPPPHPGAPHGQQQQAMASLGNISNIPGAGHGPMMGGGPMSMGGPGPMGGPPGGMGGPGGPGAMGSGMGAMGGGAPQGISSMVGGGMTAGTPVMTPVSLSLSSRIQNAKNASMCR